MKATLCFIFLALLLTSATPALRAAPPPTAPALRSAPFAATRYVRTLSPTLSPITQATLQQAAGFDCSAVTQIPQVECEALVALYASTNGAGWTNSTGWLVTLQPCSWYGVICGEGHITELNLGRNNLVGSIPPQLGNLVSLQTLSLYHNELSGPLPAQLGDLASLRIFLLYHNELSGSIPPQLGNLVSLESLYLFDNQLSGPIPLQLGDLAGLQILSLQNNQLSGSIPSQLGNLANLQYLYLFDNQLSGSIPPQLGNLTNLQQFRLDNNQLSGSIPPQLGNLANLQHLYLFDNQLNDSIPPQLGDLVSLQQLSLSRNQLSGEIPPALGNLDSLKILSLDNNQLRGSIPPQLGNLTNLQHLYLPNNQLSGEIPPALSNLTNLQYLYLAHNQLSGEIPPALSNLTNLQHLYLPNNQLSGEIPPELGDLDSLQHLYLHSNQLSGSIPWQLGNPTDLQFLYLHSNQLSGALPASLCDVATLTTTYNKLTSAAPCHPATWVDTQTIPPGNVVATPLSHSSVQFAWTRIPYTSNGGYYEVLGSPTPGGPYTALGRTASKLNAGLTLTDLPLPAEESYCFVVRTFTPAHASNQNALTSVDSVESCVLIPAAPTPTPTPTNTPTPTLTPGGFTCQTVSQIPLSECDALVALYTSTNGADWTTRSGWLISQQPCSWYGITCQNGHVIEIRINENNLRGPLPPQIGDLPELRLLILVSNQINGTLPPQLGNLLNLTTLILVSNQIGGTIPPELAALPQLNTLMLVDNRLIGPVPSAFASADMAILDIFSNGLQGNLHANLCNLSSFNANHNRFTSAAPCHPATWINTQTIPPSNVVAAPLSKSSVQLTWTPIPYTGNGGYYEVLGSPTSGGPYTALDRTASKLDAGLTLTNLPLPPGATYCFIVRTFTPAHANNQNALTSVDSLESCVLIPDEPTPTHTFTPTPTNTFTPTPTNTFTPTPTNTFTPTPTNTFTPTPTNTFTPTPTFTPLPSPNLLLAIYALAFDTAPESDLSWGYERVVASLKAASANSPRKTVVLLVDMPGDDNTFIYIFRGGEATFIEGLPDPSGTRNPENHEYDMTDGATLGGFLLWARATYATPTTATTFTYVGHSTSLIPDTDFERILNPQNLTTRLETLLAYAPPSAHTTAALKLVGTLFPLPIRVDVHPEYTDMTPKRKLLSVHELSEALRIGSLNGTAPFAVLDLIKCFGGSIEEFYALGPYATTITSAPNYAYFAPEMLGIALDALNPNDLPRDLAIALIRSYDSTIARYDPTPTPGGPPLSAHPRVFIAVQTSYLPDIKQQWDRIAFYIMDQFDRELIERAYRNAQTYYDTTYCDFPGYPADWVLDVPDSQVDLESFALALSAEYSMADREGEPSPIPLSVDILQSLLQDAVIERRVHNGTPWFVDEGARPWNFHPNSGLSIYADFVGLEVEGKRYLSWLAYFYTKVPSEYNEHPYAFLQGGHKEVSWADVFQRFWEEVPQPNTDACFPSFPAVLDTGEIGVGTIFLPYPGTTTEGSPVRPQATIHTQQLTVKATVEFTIRKANKVVYFNRVIVPALGPGSHAISASADWIPTLTNGTPESFTLEVVVDPANRVQEGNEEDNRRTMRDTIGNAPFLPRPKFTVTTNGGRQWLDSSPITLNLIQNLETIAAKINVVRVQVYQYQSGTNPSAQLPIWHCEARLSAAAPITFKLPPSVQAGPVVFHVWASSSGGSSVQPVLVRFNYNPDATPLPAGATHYYLFRATQGDKVTINLDVPSGEDATLFGWDPYSYGPPNPMWGTANEPGDDTLHIGSAPFHGTYLLAVKGGATPTSYTLTVTHNDGPGYLVESVPPAPAPPGQANGPTRPYFLDPLPVIPGAESEVTTPCQP